MGEEPEHKHPEKPQAITRAPPPPIWIAGGNWSMDTFRKIGRLDPRQTPKGQSAMPLPELWNVYYIWTNRSHDGIKYNQIESHLLGFPSVGKCSLLHWFFVCIILSSISWTGMMLCPRAWFACLCYFYRRYMTPLQRRSVQSLYWHLPLWTIHHNLEACVHFFCLYGTHISTAWRIVRIRCPSLWTIHCNITMCLSAHDLSLSLYIYITRTSWLYDVCISIAEKIIQSAWFHPYMSVWEQQFYEFYEFGLATDVHQILTENAILKPLDNSPSV